MTSHSAAERIRSALEVNSFTSGICKVPIEHCDLYYKPTSTSLACLNLATASEDELIQLVSACDAAPFGRANESIIDESYRKALKLELIQFALPFDLASTAIVNKIHQDLVADGTAATRVVRAEPYKLNIYDKGAFFKAHRDTPRADNMFGSLVLVFPTAHEGGSLVLREKGSEWTFNSGEMLANSSPDAPEIAYVAFYSDTEHEVLPVTSGTRITLTYNLYFEDTANFLAAAAAVPNAKQIIVREALQQIIDDRELLPEGGQLGFGLAHQYAIKKKKKGLGFSVPELARYLKGSDAIVYSACRELGLDVQVKLFYDDQYDGAYLASEPVADVGYEVEYGRDLYGGLELVRKGTEDWDGDSDRDRDFQSEDGNAKESEEQRIFWVIPESEVNLVDTAFIFHYGNEPSLSYIYGKVCLFVKVVRL